MAIINPTAVSLVFLRARRHPVQAAAVDLTTQLEELWQWQHNRLFFRPLRPGDPSVTIRIVAKTVTSTKIDEDGEVTPPLATSVGVFF